MDWQAVIDAAKEIGIAIGTAMATAFALVIMNEVRKLVREYSDRIRDTRIDAATDQAVTAAEQVLGEGTGEQKYSYVEQILAGRGIAPDRADIEAAVYKLTKSGGE